MFVVRLGFEGGGGDVIGGRTVENKGGKPFEEKGLGAAEGERGVGRGYGLTEGGESLGIVFTKSERVLAGGPWEDREVCQWR